MAKYSPSGFYIASGGKVLTLFIRKFFVGKTVIISLPINLYMCFGAQKNRLIETVLLSTHNICFG